jgi:hypothetical protein
MVAAGAFRVSDDSEVDIADAKVAWVEAARPILVTAAGKYRATLTYKELADAVQEDSGIHTKVLRQRWITDVLAGVARNCQAAGEPLLSSLCVNADGSNGPSYGPTVAEVRGEDAATDPDWQGAEERLACYKAFGATLPSHGGTPALTPQMAGRRERAAVKAMENRPQPVCPTCFLRLPASGPCHNCE